MSLHERLGSWGEGVRGPLLAALIACLAAAPGLFALPPLDRDESRFAEASAQMMETGDYVTIHFQATPRFKKPVGVYWLQAAAVRVFSHVEDRQIWAYRLPSLAGAMAAAAACAWGAAGFMGSAEALLAGALMGASLLLATEGAIAATDGALAGAVTLSMAALARLYVEARGGQAAGPGARALLWAGLAGSTLLKGPIGPMVFVLTLLTLGICDRRVRWMKDLGWGWGLIFTAAVIAPWAMAITVATDGEFWGAAVGGDLAPKLMDGQEGHGAPPGYYLLFAPLLLFPATLLIPAGATAAWRRRAEPGVRFALCWLIPTWLLFEVTPTKLVHYPLPLYGALAWLAICGLSRSATSPVWKVGAALSLLVAVVLAAAGPVAAMRLAAHLPLAVLVVAPLLFLLAGGVGAALLLRGKPLEAVCVTVAAALVAHAALAGLFAPQLSPIWLSSRTAQGLTAAGDNPRDGVAPGPVTVAGYAEPSLVFLLGADTELAGPTEAAAAIAQRRAAVVEGRLDDAFQAALARAGQKAQRVGHVAGLDYSNGHHDILRIYEAAPGAAPAGTGRP